MKGTVFDGRQCTYSDSLLEPLLDPHKSAPNPCFLAAAFTLSQIVLGLLVLFQIGQVLFFNKYGPFRIRYSFGDLRSVRSVGLSHIARVATALIHGFLLLTLAFYAYTDKKGPVIYQSALILSGITLLLVFPLHLLETTRSVVGHGSLYCYWASSFISILVFIINDVFLAHKLFVGESDKGLVLTVATFLAITSAIAFLLEVLFYSPSKELLEYFELNEWDPSTVRSPIESLFFLWVNPLIDTAHASDELKQSQIPSVDAGFSNKLLYENFEKNWKKEVKRAIRLRDKRVPKTLEPKEDDREIRASVLWVILKLHWFQATLAMLFLLCELTMFIIMPFAIQAFIKFFSFYVLLPDSVPKPPLVQGLVLAIAILVISVVTFVASTQSSIRFSRVSLSVRSALTTAVYEKVLSSSPETRKGKSTGEIMNLVTIDINEISGWLEMLSSAIVAPLRLVITLIALHKLLGNSTWAGLLVMVLFAPISAIVSVSIASLVKGLMEHKDRRIKLTSEILSAIKTIKMLAWERPMLQRLHEIRTEKELGFQTQIGVKIAYCMLIWESIPDWITVGVFGAFGIYSKKTLTPDLVFSSLTLFVRLLEPMVAVPFIIVQFVQLKVHLSRVESFLGLEGLETMLNHSCGSSERGETVVIKGASFLRKKDDGKETISTFALKDITFSARKGELTCIVGKVGSGKTTLLKAILGELPVSGENSKATVHGTVAYCSQNAWILNASIKENILFGKRFNKNLYDEIINACQLSPDLEVLPKGDATVVGDKGISLSGGQKARLALARAVYAQADIYLLDDVISSVDSYVGKKIVEEVLSPRGMLASKTVILATNSTRVLLESKMIYYLSNGQIVEYGPFNALKSTEGEFLRLVEGLTEGGNSEDSHSASSQSKDLLDQSIVSEVLLEAVTSSEAVESKLITEIEQTPKDMEDDTDEEMRAKGGVNKAAFFKVMEACGYTLVIAWVLFTVISVLIEIYRRLVLKLWSEQNLKAGSNVHVKLYLTLYAASGLLATFTRMGATYLMFAYCLFNCSLFFHDRLAHNVMRAPMSFFDTTPSGRILNRFTSDIAVMDIEIILTLGNLGSLLALAMVQMATLVVNLPIISIALIFLLALFRGYRNRYVPASRELKRLLATLKSPIMSHLQESIEGVETIRAYKEKDRFFHTNSTLLDQLTKVSFVEKNVANWLSVRLLSLSASVVFTTTLLCFITLLTKKPLSPGMVGFLLTCSISSTLVFDAIIRLSSKAEVDFVSVERILEYLAMAQEAPEVIEGQRPEQNWPSGGLIEFRKYSAGYRPELPAVLKNLNFTIKPGEKIGIVGRTGAGKSTLALALLRLIEAKEGSIFMDSVDTSQIGLYDLRKLLNIIPQDAHAFDGTARDNLDPFGNYTDEELWRVLELAHLKQHFENAMKESDESNDAPSNGLDVKISEGGSNLSGGQKQLVCLARALLKQSQVLILDEATASVDVETDRIIQETIRTEFKKRTILTIAHRLETIMDSDKILVLDKGEVKEFDSPQALLSDKTSEFYALCKEAGLTS